MLNLREGEPLLLNGNMHENDLAEPITIIYWNVFIQDLVDWLVCWANTTNSVGS